MQQRFSNTIVLVTGAAHGIGRAIALRCGSEGAQVIVNDVNAAGAEATVQQIINSGGSAALGAADVSSKEQVDRLFNDVLKRFGTVDVLVNNAGLINVERLCWLLVVSGGQHWPVRTPLTVSCSLLIPERKSTVSTIHSLIFTKGERTLRKGFSPASRG